MPRIKDSPKEPQCRYDRASGLAPAQRVGTLGRPKLGRHKHVPKFGVITRGNTSGSREASLARHVTGPRNVSFVLVSALHVDRATLVVAQGLPYIGEWGKGADGRVRNTGPAQNKVSHPSHLCSSVVIAWKT